MCAIILAAGRGLRLQRADQRQFPKCLLQFGGMSLLERHLRMPKNVGVEEIVVAVGFRPDRIEAELDRLHWTPRPEIVLNERFEFGSVPVELRKQLTADLKYDTIGAAHEVLPQLEPISGTPL
jgi:choline kinase